MLPQKNGFIDLEMIILLLADEIKKQLKTENDDKQNIIIVFYAISKPKYRMSKDHYSNSKQYPVETVLIMLL